MHSLLATFAGFHGWQIGLTATLLLLQGVAVAIFPEELILLTLGLLWSQGRITMEEAWISVVFGLLPANALLFLIGRQIESRLGHFRLVRWLFKAGSANWALDFVRKFGPAVVIVTRFTPMIRGPVYLACGLSAMRMRTFIRLDFAASCVQIPLLLWLGRILGQNSGSLIEAYVLIGKVMAGLILAGLLTGFLIKRARLRALVPSSPLAGREPRSHAGCA